MTLRLPSFRSQIILLVVILILTSVLFFRDFFISSFDNYTQTTEALNINDELRDLHKNYNNAIDDSNRDQFRSDLEDIMSTENQKAIARDAFNNEIKLYSKFILFFLITGVVILFLISFYFITRPLKRLQDATLQIAQGDLAVIVKESKFSPLNDLIVSFNSMTQELLFNRKKIIQAEKDAAWRDMARILAHEIKNPLTPMRLSLERLEMKYAMKSNDLDDVFKTVTRVIHEEINSLQSFATEFSKFARLPEGTPIEYNLNEQIIDICSPYQSEIKIKLNLGNKLPLLFADKAQIKQVFENLVQNSINAAKDNFILKINTSNTDSLINISMLDNGLGINKDDLSKIFKPYFSKSHGGTGLGLAIVKRIVENHGGIIKVESQVDFGTTFSLSFPISKNKESL